MPTDIAKRNRENAQRSTGPRTADGKAKSSLNAVTHGMRSESLTLPGESTAGADAMVRATQQSLSLAGPVGASLARDIVVASKREKRIERFENALRQQAIEAAEDLSRYPETEILEKLEEQTEPAMRIRKLLQGDDWRSTPCDRIGAEHLLGLLRNLIDSIPLEAGESHPTASSLLDLQSRINKFDFADNRAEGVMAEMGRIAGQHLDFMLEKIERLKTRRDRKISLAKKTAAIPNETELKRLERYRAMNEKSVLRKLEMARIIKELTAGTA